MEANRCLNCKNCEARFRKDSAMSTLEEDTCFICNKRHLATNPFSNDYDEGCSDSNLFERRENSELSAEEKLALDILCSSKNKRELFAEYKTLILNAEG